MDGHRGDRGVTHRHADLVERGDHVARGVEPAQAQPLAPVGDDAALVVDPQAKLLAKTLDAATGKLLDNNKNPSPKTGQLDNRGSQFYLALYWAQELAAQGTDPALAAKFAPLAKMLADNEQKIVDELNAVQGQPVDIGGYYFPDREKVSAVMVRISVTAGKRYSHQ